MDGVRLELTGTQCHRFYGPHRYQLRATHPRVIVDNNSLQSFLSLPFRFFLYPERDSNSHFSELKSDASSCWAIGAVYDRIRTCTVCILSAVSLPLEYIHVVHKVGFEPTLSASLMLCLFRWATRAYLMSDSNWQGTGFESAASTICANQIKENC